MNKYCQTMKQPFLVILQAESIHLMKSLGVEMLED
jgi:hypothetical protein